MSALTFSVSPHTAERARKLICRELTSYACSEGGACWDSPAPQPVDDVAEHLAESMLEFTIDRGPMTVYLVLEPQATKAVKYTLSAEPSETRGWYHSRAKRERIVHWCAACEEPHPFCADEIPF